MVDGWGAFSSSFVPKEPGQHRLLLSCLETGSTIEAKVFVEGSISEPIGKPARRVGGDFESHARGDGAAGRLERVAEAEGGDAAVHALMW
jgi:hypothetical protein